MLDPKIEMMLPDNPVKKLAVDHPYYCSSENYYSTKDSYIWETMTEFLDNMEDTDVDMNLCFRWDVMLDEDDATQTNYVAEVFIMHQRKGLFVPHYIKSITNDEVDRFKSYLKKHWETLNKMWMPIANNK
jgi:predicted oxidoreductase